EPEGRHPGPCVLRRTCRRARSSCRSERVARGLRVQGNSPRRQEPYADRPIREGTAKTDKRRIPILHGADKQQACLCRGRVPAPVRQRRPGTYWRLGYWRNEPASVYEGFSFREGPGPDARGPDFAAQAAEGRGRTGKDLLRTEVHGIAGDVRCL